MGGCCSKAETDPAQNNEEIAQSYSKQGESHAGMQILIFKFHHFFKQCKPIVCTHILYLKFLDEIVI